MARLLQYDFNKMNECVWVQCVNIFAEKVDIRAITVETQFAGETLKVNTIILSNYYNIAPLLHWEADIQLLQYHSTII